MGGVDAGLAANGRINLGQKRCWNLDEVNATPENGCCKACEIANHTTTESNNPVAPFNACRQQFFAQVSQSGEAFGFFAGGQDDGNRFDACRSERCFQCLEMVARHIFIGDNCGEGTVQKRSNVATCFPQQVFSDMDIIRPVPEINGDSVAALVVTVRHCLIVPNPAIWPEP